MNRDLRTRVFAERAYVATVFEQQEKAKEFERSGDTVAALAIYDDLVRQFESDPTILDGAPDLYVRVGDLRSRLGESDSAFDAYHQAAEHFALRGSAENVANLCFRMTHLSPAAAAVYGRYARRLNDYGYADSALKILKEYATTAGLDAVSDEITTAQAQARSGSSPQMKELLDNFENALSHNEPAPGEIGPPAEQQTEPAPPLREKPVVAQPEQQRKNRRSWMYALGAVVLVSASLAAVVMAMGDDRGSVPTPTFSVAAVTSSVPTLAAERADESGAQVLDSVAAVPTAASFAPVVPAHRDSAPRGSQPATDATPRVITEPIVVGDLAIRRISEVEYRGQRGFRVVHLLDSGAEFTVESYPVDDNTAATYRVGTVLVNVLPPDTIVSIVRLDERHLVFTSGVVPADSARILTCKLRVGEPSS